MVWPPKLLGNYQVWFSPSGCGSIQSQVRCVYHRSKCASSQESITSANERQGCSATKPMRELCTLLLNEDPPWRFGSRFDKGPPNWCTVMSLWLPYAILHLISHCLVVSGGKSSPNPKVQRAQWAHQGVSCMILHILDWCRWANPQFQPISQTFW